ncbi:HAD-like protein [Epithele typhae]|uniref:HAD-like protein n=1 Tax=Epithele typhae TaxID=378194 RepID=UPI0020079423|nr:HAD-like protein [Epithele typhae]KAH9944967.1 HAD-like protein [Epithele typhae]
MSPPSYTPLELSKLKDYKALVFDCYGTLIDWETGIHTALAPLFAAAGRPTDRGTVIGAFAAVEPALQARFPTMRYPDVLALAYTTIHADLHGPPPPSSSSPSPGEVERQARAFADAVETWPPFPDTVAALQTLQRRFKLAILSNIDRATIARTRRHMEGPGGFAFDGVYTAEEVGAYKPAPEMLTFALERLKTEFGIESGEVLVTAQSVFHDIVPARGRGLGTAWINRAGAVTGKPEVGEEGQAMFVFPTLGAMAEAVETAYA